MSKNIFHRPTLATLAFVLATVLLNTAHASTVLVDETRQVRSNGAVGSETSFESWIVEERSAGTFGEFNFVIDESRNAGLNSSSGSASLQSNISSQLFSAQATTHSSAEFNEATSNYISLNGNGLAKFEVTFKILEPALFTLDGLLAFDQILGSSRGSALITLIDNSYSGGNFQLTFGQSSAYSDFSQTIRISGLLEPATYTLRAYANSMSDTYSIGTAEEAFASFDVNLALHMTPVPIPAAVWLFSAALVMLARFRRNSGRINFTQ